MCLTVVQRSQRIPVPLLLIADSLCSKLFDSNEYSHTISDLLDPHLFEYKLITLNKVTSRDIVS